MRPRAGRRSCPSSGRAKCARAMFSRAHTDTIASASRSIESGRSTAAERALPGTSTRTTRWRAKRVHQRRPGVAAAAQAVHADDGVAAAFVLDGDACRSGGRPSSLSRARSGSRSRRGRRPRCGTRRPRRSHFGGLKPMPTPAQVPVAITSPGCSVMPREQVSISVGMSKIMSFVLQSWRSSARRPGDEPAAHARVAAVEFVDADDPRAPSGRRCRSSCRGPTAGGAPARRAR